MASIISEQIYLFKNQVGPLIRPAFAEIVSFLPFGDSVDLTPFLVSQLCFIEVALKWRLCTHSTVMIAFVSLVSQLPIDYNMGQFCGRWCNKTNSCTNTTNYHIMHCPLFIPHLTLFLLSYSCLMPFIFLNLLYLFFDRLAHSTSSTN